MPAVPCWKHAGAGSAWRRTMIRGDRICLLPIRRPTEVGLAATFGKNVFTNGSIVKCFRDVAPSPPAPLPGECPKEWRTHPPKEGGKPEIITRLLCCRAKIANTRVLEWFQFKKEGRLSL